MVCIFASLTVSLVSLAFWPRSVIELARQSLDVTLRAEFFSPRLMEVIFLSFFLRF
jgi:hypothetical protein